MEHSTPPDLLAAVSIHQKDNILVIFDNIIHITQSQIFP